MPIKAETEIMERYEKYKDSGIEWIGEIPENWEVKRVAGLGTFSKGKGISRSELKNNGSPAILYGDIYTKYNIKTETIFSHIDVETTKSSVKIMKGDLLFTGSGETKEDIGKCITYLGNEIVYAGGDVIILSQNKCDSLFLSYSLNSNASIYQKASMAKGQIIIHIYASNLREMIFPVPPLKEQTAIANYLDRKTTEIDDLIAKKEQLLALYEEEKTAIINQAVTGKLKIKNEKLKMKDSGIDWLGEIPEHWGVKRLKYVISKAGSGVTPKGGANVYQLSGIPLLRSQNIHFDGLKLDDVAYISEDIHNDMSNSKVKNGDVLLNITGASIGRCHFITNDLGEANVNQHVCIIRPKSEITTKFLFYILRSNIGQEQINQEQTGSGREGLNFESLKNFIVLSFNRDEQTVIVAHIEKETARIDAKIVRTKKLIALQKEYRTALISEVVTGKIKVIK